MKKNITITILIFFFVFAILIYGCAKETPGPIGGQRDEHGCLGPAGYSWNASIFACIREWELNEDQRKAVQIAIGPLSYYVTVIQVDSLDCEGCYAVHLQRNDNQNNFEINLIDWKHSNMHVCTKEEKKAEICTMEYAPVCGDNNKTYGNGCSACGSKEIDYWAQGECEVQEKHVCTEQESLATACTMEYAPVCGELLLNTGKIVHQTFGNGCSACSAMKVVSYTPGECTEIDSFEACENAGLPIMESYPRQCKAGDKTFVEEVNTISTQDCTKANGRVVSEKIDCKEKEYDGGIVSEDKKCCIPCGPCPMYDLPPFGWCQNGEILSVKGQCDCYGPPRCYCNGTDSRMEVGEAVEIAMKSECADKGELLPSRACNMNTQTFWIGLEMKPEFKNELCSPACVVYIDNKTAEINWMCRGLKEE